LDPAQRWQPSKHSGRVLPDPLGRVHPGQEVAGGTCVTEGQHAIKPQGVQTAKKGRS